MEQKMKKIVCIIMTVLILLCCFMFTMCPMDVTKKPGGNDDTPPDWTIDDPDNDIIINWNDIASRGGIKVSIDIAESFQTMRNFAASDAWNAQHVGKHWAEDKKEQIAKWLFSQDFDSAGNPLGIGLSQWRVNFGAGSWEQGAQSLIGIDNNPNETMLTCTSSWHQRAECWLADISNPKGAAQNPQNPSATLYTHPVSGITYDFSKAEGQVWFFKKAMEMGVESLAGFSNSPPVAWTINGWATNAASGSQPGVYPSGGSSYRLRAQNANLRSNAYGDLLLIWQMLLIIGQGKRLLGRTAIRGKSILNIFPG